MYDFSDEHVNWSNQSGCEGVCNAKVEIRPGLLSLDIDAESASRSSE